MVSAWDLGSTASWLCSPNKVEGWEKPEFIPIGWQRAAELGTIGMIPWELEREFAQALSAASLAGHVRAALVAADPLTTALGRPNREQVITARPSAATTLQALEMTNGKTMADQLKKGAEKILADRGTASPALISTLFQRALARPPQPEELEMSMEVLGNSASREGLEDLLWAVAMLPEFQLIH